MPENVLVVNAEGPETRVGLLEDGVLVEYFLERKRERGIVGNIYRGKVTRVLPGMQAAFVDLGPTVEKAAFLYVADVLGAADERKLFDLDDEPTGSGTRNSRGVRSRRKAASRKIEDLLKANQHVLVQIVKDPIGPKGARVTGYISLPGRYGVLMPAVDNLGISRRIATEGERKRVRDIVKSVRPKGVGFIVRTAAEGADENEIRDDLGFLVRLWTEIGKREASSKGPGLIYADLDLVLRMMRDQLGDEISEVVIDSESVYERARKFVGAFLPRYVDRIKHYDGRQPIFDHYGIEAEVRAAIRRRVPLASGGHLVIDQSEALTAIDVNTGSFVGKDDLEKTVTANNLEATQEIARQLRLRNIGGIVVLDLVDMDKQANREKVWEALNRALAPDSSRCNLTKISELGLVEMTRKRTRESLKQVLTDTCPTCGGAGVVKSSTTVAYEILREVRRLGSTVVTDSIEIECAAPVAEHLRKHERDYTDELEKRFQKKLEIRVSGALAPDEYKVAGHKNEPAQAAPAPARGRKRSGRSRSSAGKKKTAAGSKSAASSRAAKAGAAKKKRAAAKSKAAARASGKTGSGKAGSSKTGSSKTGSSKTGSSKADGGKAGGTGRKRRTTRRKRSGADSAK